MEEDIKTRNSSNGLPLQAIPLSKKTRKWREQTVEHFINISCFGDGSYWNNNYSSRSLKTQIKKSYEYYNGKVHYEDYSHILNPYNLDDANKQSTSAKVRNYNIIRPIVNLLVGEYIKRPDNFAVTLSNDDVNTIKEQELRKVITDNLVEHFMSELSRLGLAPMDESGQPRLPQEIEEHFAENYTDARVIEGSEALNFIEFHQKVKNKYIKAFFHFVVSGLVFTEKKIVADEVVFRVLNPLSVDAEISDDIDFIEDATWAVKRRNLTISDIISEYYEHLDSDDVKRIETELVQEEFTWSDEIVDREERTFKFSGLPVYTVYWKTLKKVGIVQYTDEWGRESEFEVEDDYTPEEGETVNWYWLNEVWEGTRIGEDLYINIEPFPIQRNSLDNKSTCKLPINGRVYSDTNAPAVSIVDILKPFQIIYNIYKFRIDSVLAKAKGVIAQLDISMKPVQFETIEDWLYYIDNLGIMFTERTTEAGIYQNQNYKDVLDLSAKAIREYLELLSFAKSEAYETLGITYQRLGATSQYDGQGVTEQSIVQSSHITELLFNGIEQLKESDRQGFIDLSKITFIAGKKGQFINPDGSIVSIDIDGLRHMESEYGIFVTNSSEEQQKIRALKALGQQMIQAGWKASTIADIFEENNYTKIKQKIKKAEETTRQLQEAQQRLEQQMAQAQAQDNQAEREFKAVENEKDRQNQIELAEINARRFDMTDSTTEQEKLQKEYEIKNRELDIKEKEIEKKFEIEKEKVKVAKAKTSNK